MTIPHELLGTIPGWITAAAAVTGLVVAFLKFGIKWRGQTIDQSEKLIAALGVRLDAKDAAFRDLEKHWRDLSEQADRRYEECIKERDQDRAEINTLKNEIQGLIRIIAQASADKVLRLQANMTPQALKAAVRVAQMIHEGEGK